MMMISFFEKWMRHGWIPLVWQSMWILKNFIAQKPLLEQKGTKNAELIKIEGNGTVYQSA